MEKIKATIIDGNNTGTVVKVNADNVKISGFTIQNSIPLGNGIENGIYVSFSNNITISGNIFLYNGISICLFHSSNNRIDDNIVLSYLVEGIALLENCYFNTISGNKIDYGRPEGLYRTGIGLSWSSSANVISGNTILNNYGGIAVFQSQSNKIIGNNLINNYIGISLQFSGNTVYHNNFINNDHGAIGDKNTWDNGAEGNYWSDYNGTDMNGDGIGDTPYIINGKNQDNYPLMAPWSELRVFNVSWGEKVYQVTTFSHSTIASFNFSQSNKQISFNVTGPSSSFGFCNVTIPKTLLRANETHAWKVLLDGSLIDYTKVENETHTSLYFTYAHSTHYVQIIGTWVTPEFPIARILPLLTIITLVATILRKMIQPTRSNE